MNAFNTKGSYESIMDAPPGVEPVTNSENSAAAGRILAVTEEELQRIVLDIHDGPVQQLFAASAQVKLMQLRLQRDEEISAHEWFNYLSQQAELLSSIQQEIRNFLGAFRPPSFPHRELIDILQGLIMQHENFTGCQVDLIVEPADYPASLPVKIALYRICQEALSNAFRHAGVSKQSVHLRREDALILLVVEDAGRGFEPPPLHGPGATEREEHIGLRGMRDRVTLVNGRIRLTSAPGQGTRIEVSVPANE